MEVHALTENEFPDTLIDCLGRRARPMIAQDDITVTDSMQTELAFDRVEVQHGAVVSMT